MIAVKGLSKQFGGFLALDQLSFEVGKGEFYCLLGPNGAGKTTTLKIIGGLMQPTEGQVVMNGIDISDQPQEVKKFLGFVPDTPFLYENLTACEFLDFVADVFGLDQAAYRSARDHYFDLFRLEGFRHSFIKDLSHGSQQKIVYISNFIHSPSIYLIDEPLVGLDPYSIHLLKKILKEETAQGKTILMCTHILSIAEELADRIGILHEGRLIAQGTPQQIKDKLATDSLEQAFLQLTCQR